MKTQNKYPRHLSALLAIAALLFVVTGCKMASDLVGSVTGHRDGGDGGFFDQNAPSEGKNQANQDDNPFVGTWKPAADSLLKDEFQSVVINNDQTYKVTGKHDRIETGSCVITSSRLTFGGPFGEELKKNGVENITVEGGRMKWSGSGEGIYYFDKVSSDGSGDFASMPEKPAPASPPSQSSSPSVQSIPSSPPPSVPTPSPNLSAPVSAPVSKEPAKPAEDSARMVSVGVLNGKATSLPSPGYPAAAKAVHASGAVNVQVTIDESGNVTSESATSGHPLLRAAAESAARQAKFNPLVVGGKHVKMSGVITYNFQAQ